MSDYGPIQRGIAGVTCLGCVGLALPHVHYQITSERVTPLVRAQRWLPAHPEDPGAHHPHPGPPPEVIQAVTTASSTTLQVIAFSGARGTVSVNLDADVVPQRLHAIIRLA